MSKYESIFPLDDFLNLKTSTTFFLEKVKGLKMHSKILFQEEVYDEEGRVHVERIVSLYFERPDQPVLYCKSVLFRDQLTDREYDDIINKAIPIGRIFHKYNRMEEIGKTDFSIIQSTSSEIATSLNVENNSFYQKRYQYWVSNRKVGIITEYFNDLSLMRSQKVAWVDNSSIITDGKCTVKYDGLSYTLGNDLLEAMHSADCVAIPTSNSPHIALLIFYCIQNGINCFLTSTNLSEELPGFCDVILELNAESIDQTKLRANSNFCNEPSSIVKGEKGLVILSSSGSTGKPKYICHRKENLLANARKVVDHFGITSQCRILVTVPIGHMFGLGVGLLPALMTGASIWIIDKNNLIKYLEGLNKFRPNFTLITAMVCRMIVSISKKIVTNTLHISAGERLDEQTYQRFEEQVGTLINLYGSSEMGALATSVSDNLYKELRHKGWLQPLEGVEVSCSKFDDQLQCKHPFPFYTYIQSSGLKIDTPFTDEGWFDTKDIGEVDDEKGLKIFGRLDNRMNRSGFLVSLEEVESQIKSIFPDLTQLVVVEVEKTGRGSSMIAVVEYKSSNFNERLMRKELQKYMSKHQVPDEIFFVSKMKTLKNGKPDRMYIKSNASSIERLA
ncbi:fatty acid--CoA ligase family protein [Fulvivirga maritima]|uniref:ANL family adenylate-forming protein n=1 Tax=Fulvivirga maritima TaxID=2904247 RepID=UPI001F2D4E38|nr:fatty acid--CoA ligase family protein [Fulvivirga maritima]UII27575.1 fatty acid--CoA ligase family protein [Fulvivirga maritima]